MLNMLMSILQPSHPDDIKSWLVYAPERGKKMFRKIYRSLAQVSEAQSNRQSFYTPSRMSW